MRMFINLPEVEPMLARLGFTDIKIDTGNSEMQFDIEEDEDQPTTDNSGYELKEPRR